MRSKLSILFILFLFIGSGFTQDERSMSQNLTYLSTGVSLQMAETGNTVKSTLFSTYTGFPGRTSYSNDD